MLRIFALILGAAWFFPVSCTVGVIGGTHLLSKLDTRYVSKDDPLHGRFYVAVQFGGNSSDFQLNPLDEVPALLKRGTYSVFLANQEIQKNIGEYAKVSYSIIDSGSEGKLIETVYSDDDVTVWSRYWATSGGVEPVSSRIMHISYMFRAFIWSFCGALLLYFIGRQLRLRLPVPNKTPNQVLKRTG